MEKVAVIGLGNIATRHRRNLKHLFPRAHVYAMSASGRETNEEISDADSIAISVAHLIEERVQLVIVASPAPFHARHAIPFIEAGVPVLIEKPVTATQEELKVLLDVASANKSCVAVGYCLRYMPSALVIKELITSEKIGNLYNVTIEVGQYLPDWRPSKDYRDSVSVSPKLGGGALLELSHEIDYAHWLLGDLELQHAILRQSKELNLEVEDVADMFFTTAEDAVVNIHLDFLQRRAFRQCRFVGSKGTLEWNLIDNTVLFSSAQGIEVVYNQPQWDKNLMYISMILDFLALVKKEPNNCVSLRAAAKTVELIEHVKARFPMMSEIDSPGGSL